MEGGRQPIYTWGTVACARLQICSCPTIPSGIFAEFGRKVGQKHSALQYRQNFLKFRTRKHFSTRQPSNVKMP